MPRCGADHGLQAHAALLGRDAHARAGAGEIVVEPPAAEPRREARIDLRRRRGRRGLLRERAAGRQRSRREGK